MRGGAVAQSIKTRTAARHRGMARVASRAHGQRGGPSPWPSGTIRCHTLLPEARTEPAMELKYSPLSPFGRKITILAHEFGIAGRIALTTVSTRGEPEKLTPFNPLGKVPELVTDGGAVLYDSKVICEYIDAEFGNHRFLPAAGLRRWEVLTRCALADGIAEAGVQIRYERARPEAEQSPAAVEWQQKKIRLGYDQWEKLIAGFDGNLDLGHINLGAGMGYLEKRVAELSGMKARPRLWDWYRRMCDERESFRLTMPTEQPSARPPTCGSPAPGARGCRGCCTGRSAWRPRRSPTRCPCARGSRPPAHCCAGPPAAPPPRRTSA